MAVGEEIRRKHSPIVEAIAEAEQGTSGEIRVHLSRKWMEKDPYRRALRIFQQHGMTKTSHRNAVLLYINLRKRKFAIIGDQGLHDAVGQIYWERLVRELQENLRSTHIERAIALAVRTLGETLRRYFPAEYPRAQSALSDEVTEG